MKVTITIDEKTIKKLIADYVASQLGDASVSDVRLLVKSKQNYRSTWEPCAMLVTNDEGRAEFQQATTTTEIKAEAQ